MQDIFRWLPFRTAINKWRQQDLNLPPLGINHIKDSHVLKIPTIYGFSPNFIPKPESWEKHIDITGYWFLDDLDWQPPQELVDFLEAGPSPVCISFSSMVADNPEKVANIILQALAKTKQRGVFLTGWNNFDQIDWPDTVFKIKEAPHTWLFPRMAAVIHHGGAGTTGVSLKSGIPSIITPFFFDQPF